MKTKQLVALLVAVAVGLPSGHRAFAGVIIFDSFTDANGTADTAHTPNVNLPGGSYVHLGYSNSYPNTIQSDTLQTNANSGSILSLSSAGSYVKPTTFTESATLEIGTLSGTATDPDGRGTGIGFYSSGYNTNNEVIAGNTFSGLVMAPDGTLGLYVAGAATGESVAFGGTFVPTNSYTLSYSVNTGTGAISNISLSGSTANYSSLTSTAFTNANTAFAGITSSSTAGNTFGAASNFTVSSVPEPSSLLLLGLGAAGVVVAVRRCRHA